MKPSWPSRGGGLGSIQKLLPGRLTRVRRWSALATGCYAAPRAAARTTARTRLPSRNRARSAGNRKKSDCGLSPNRHNGGHRRIMVNRRANRSNLYQEGSSNAKDIPPRDLEGGGRRLLLTAALGVAATAVAEHKPFV